MRSKTNQLVRTTARCLATAAGVGMASYGAYAACTWLRYGRVNPPHADKEDALLDRFMPVYEVAERHHVRVHAPCDVTMAAASEMDLQQSWIVRSIFKGREWIMRSESASEPQTRSFLEQVRALGWGKLAEVAGREIVMGAVTQPWLPNVVFRSMPPEHFASFNDPDYVKIAWTLRVDPINPIESAFRTETRVQCTDATARAKFRRYWSFASPGIILIRWISLSLVKHEAERRVRKIRHTVLSSTANIPLN